MGGWEGTKEGGRLGESEWNSAGVWLKGGKAEAGVSSGGKRDRGGTRNLPGILIDVWITLWGIARGSEWSRISGGVWKS